MLIIKFLLVLIFILLSLLHFYWGAGGKWWLDNSLPIDIENENIKYPSSGLTYLVAIGLLFFAMNIACFSNLIVCPFPIHLSKYVVYVLALILILRVVGDFKYFGLFRKVKNTTFAKYDVLIYTPLCLALFILTILLIVNN